MSAIFPQRDPNVAYCICGEPATYRVVTRDGRVVECVCDRRSYQYKRRWQLQPIERVTT